MTQDNAPDFRSKFAFHSCNDVTETIWKEFEKGDYVVCERIIVYCQVPEPSK